MVPALTPPPLLDEEVCLFPRREMRCGKGGLGIVWGFGLIHLHRTPIWDAFIFFRLLVLDVLDVLDVMVVIARILISRTVVLFVAVETAMIDIACRGLQIRVLILRRHEYTGVLVPNGSGYRKRQEG